MKDAVSVYVSGEFSRCFYVLFTVLKVQKVIRLRGGRFVWK